MSKPIALLVGNGGKKLETVLPLLQKDGYEPIVMNGPGKALRYLSAGAEADVLLTHSELKGINGLELASRARKMRPDIITIMLMDNDDIEATARAARFGCVNRFFPGLPEYADLRAGIEKELSFRSAARVMRRRMAELNNGGIVEDVFCVPSM